MDKDKMIIMSHDQLKDLVNKAVIDTIDNVNGNGKRFWDKIKSLTPYFLIIIAIIGFLVKDTVWGGIAELKDNQKTINTRSIDNKETISVICTNVEHVRNDMKSLKKYVEDQTGKIIETINKKVK